MQESVFMRRLWGKEIEPFAEAIAALRLDVLREYPYLMAGERERELAHVQGYVDCPEAVGLIAFTGTQVVGAALGRPLVYEPADVGEAFAAHGRAPEAYFHLGEALLAPSCRGQGIGEQFMALREAAAAKLPECQFCSLCLVDRPANDPRRPTDFLPLDPYFARHGYEPHPELRCTARWRDLGQTDETAKTLVFWLKPRLAVAARPR